MNCPRCRGREMEARPGPLGIEVDACGGCGSLWLDRIELFAYAPQARRRLAEMLEQSTKLTIRSPLSCPRCEVPLSKGPAGGLLLERCPKCEGLWLDASELEALLRSAEG